MPRAYRSMFLKRWKCTTTSTVAWRDMATFTVGVLALPCPAPFAARVHRALAATASSYRNAVCTSRRLPREDGIGPESGDPTNTSKPLGGGVAVTVTPGLRRYTEGTIATTRPYPEVRPGRRGAEVPAGGPTKN